MSELCPDKIFTCSNSDRVVETPQIRDITSGQCVPLEAPTKLCEKQLLCSSFAEKSKVASNDINK